MTDCNVPAFGWLALGWWGFGNLCWAVRWWAWRHPDFDTWLRRELARSA